MQKKKTYAAPVLERFGSVQDLTHVNPNKQYESNDGWTYQCVPIGNGHDKPPSTI